MKTAVSILILIAALTVAAFAQSAPAGSTTPAVISVAASEASAISAAQKAYQAAQQAEAAPLKALLATPAQQALHAATVAALDGLKSALDTSAASHAVDTNQMQYSVSGSAWTKNQGGSGGVRGGAPITQ